MAKKLDKAIANMRSLEQKLADAIKLKDEAQQRLWSAESAARNCQAELQQAIQEVYKLAGIPRIIFP